MNAFTSKWKLLAPLVIGVSVWLCGVPAGLTEGAWLFVSLFVALIVGLVLEPLPSAFIGLIGIVVAILFRVGPDPSSVVTANNALAWGLAGFSNAVVWLIFSAFMLGIGYQKSGLGRRIGLFLAQKLGKSSIGLGYAVAITDIILAPFIPSNAARSGGVIYPIVSNIPPMFDSYPDKNPEKIGKYLTWTGLTTTAVSSSMFLTGQAANPFALSLAIKAGGVDISWINWFLAFAPVGIILFLISPILCYVFVRPTIKGSTETVEWAKKELRTCGKMTASEIRMTLISILALVLWVGASILDVSPTTTGLLVIVLMIGCKIITWDDFLSNKAAWNVLVWFATLIPMAGGLKNVGFLDWLGKMTSALLNTLDPSIAAFTLVIMFVVLRYFFASATAYVTATLGLFTALAYNIPGVSGTEILFMLLLPIGLVAVMTPYAGGHSPIWYATGFSKGVEYWRLGFIFTVIYLFIFIVISKPWLAFILPRLGIQ